MTPTLDITPELEARLRARINDVGAGRYPGL